MKISKDLLTTFVVLFCGIVSVAAFQGSSLNYDINNKLDFGTTSQINSTSYNQRFISGFEPIGYYRSLDMRGRFGVLFDAANFFPSIYNISLTSLDGTNTTSQNLNCSATLVDLNNDNMNITVKWYSNSVEYLEINYSNSYANGTFFSAELDNIHTSKGQNWTCAMRGYGGGDYGAWYFSEGLIILNTPPVINLTYPFNVSYITNRNTHFNWTANDDDNDTLSYDINISLVASSLCTDPNRFIEDLSNETYNLTSPLNCFYDNEDYYVWSVRASDGEVTIDWVPPFIFYLSSLLDISLPVDFVAFGNLSYLGSNNTTDNSPLPFQIQNDGNSLINVNISATDLWSTVANPTPYYQLKVDNLFSEMGSFNWDESTTDWANAPANNDTIIISGFNYLDTNDTAEVDIYVEVPINEIPEAKTSILTFIANFGE